MIYGDLIKKIRSDKGISQQDLADAMSIERASLSLIENGKRKLLVKELEDLCEFVGISIQEFFNKDPSEQEKVKWKKFFGNETLKPYGNYIVRHEKSSPIVACWSGQQREFYIDFEEGLPLKVTEYIEIPD